VHFVFREIKVPFRIRINDDDFESTINEIIIHCMENRLATNYSLILTTKHLYDLYLRKVNIPNAKFVFITDTRISTILKVYNGYLLGNSFPVIVGIGGGKVIDAAKYLGFLKALPVISVPTTLSNDGICSPVSVLIDENGKKQSIRSTMPIAVIGNLDIIKKSPIKYISAGIGDMLAKISSLKDWRLAHEDIGENIDDTAYLLMHTAVMNLLRKLKYEIDNIDDVLNESFLNELFYALTISGISMYITGSSRPASGAEHMISHAIDYLYPHKSGIHGFQVAYGTLITEVLRGEDISELVEIFKKVGLPTSYKELNLTEEEIVNAVLYAPRIRNRYTIFNRINLNKRLVKNTIEKVERISQSIDMKREYYEKAVSVCYYKVRW